jgi:hypothetical protein
MMIVIHVIFFGECSGFWVFECSSAQVAYRFLKISLLGIHAIELTHLIEQALLNRVVPFF